MKGRKIKSERIARTCGAALAVSLAVANVNYAVCEVGASAQAGRVIQNSTNTSKKKTALTPTPSVTPRLKISPTPAVTAVPTAAPVVTSAPAATPEPVPQTPVYTPVPEPTQAPVVTEVPADTSVPEPVYTPAPEATQTPSASETPMPDGSITPSASETPMPDGSITPSASGTPVPDESITPSVSKTPLPDGSITPSASGTPLPDGSIAPSASETPEPGVFDSDGWETAGDGYQTEQMESEPDVPDVSFVGSEELVGFTTFASVKKAEKKTAAVAKANLELMVAGSSPLVGGEIADNVYRDSTPEATEAPKKAAATAAPTETPVSDWASETAESISSDKEKKDAEPVLGEPDDAEGSDAKKETSVQTSRFGVLTGDTTDIFSYLAVGLSSIVVAFLTFFTMCARSRRRPEEERPEQ